MADQTTNLKINLISSSDYVSPTPINDAIKALDALGVDYVTASGTSGNWAYRKWKSGQKECWGTFSYSATTASGYIACSQAFPSGLFSASPAVSLAAGVDGLITTGIGYTRSSSSKVEFYVNKPSEQSAGYTVYVHAFGK